MQTIQSSQVLSLKPPKAHAWLQALLIGFLFYIISTGVLFLTENPNLFPTVVMIGSFLVPVAYVTFFYERRHLSNITISTTFISFVYGGVLGVLAASLLEPIFVRSTNTTSVLSIGLIEEFTKILGVLIIARRFRHDMEMDGLILGAAAGMGFAALESMGYAFTAFLSSGGSVSQTVLVTLIRGILSPIGHGTWTAIFASVLFREAKGSHFRINYKVVVAYAIVSVLHALWDGLPTIITDYFGSGLDVFLGQAFIGAAGLFILWLRYREANRLQQASALAPVMITPPTAPEIGVENLPTDEVNIAPMIENVTLPGGNIASQGEYIAPIGENTPPEGENIAPTA